MSIEKVRIPREAFAKRAAWYYASEELSIYLKL
jgi:hypothetical protein